MSREARRQDLIAAALELFGRRSPEQVSAEDVVALAGVSRPLFYRYFSSVRELHVAALRSVTDGLVEQLAVRAEGDPVRRLRAAVRGLMEVAAEYRAAYVALLRSGSVIATAETDAVVDEVRRRSVALILEELGVAEPSPRLLLTLRCWTAVVEGAVLAWLQEDAVPGDDLDVWLVDQLTAMLTATARHDPAVPDLRAQREAYPSTS
ncbi:TetR/AcrR family transcriptional regulator [Amycolatopsis suaedae]|uniref:TetR/AcrR family transcriptional regulator n=1 Tax=Amycolatopsis suaedae TaxID=2510978 RepID=A0A4Q7J9K6_9PSEU|nr:TetR/AcrR family transcriptional regulator [Amycolatopsis suaedae]RZQ63616.1 TetR/AcrR family transcriptional regulator [Amycolatopsis suaedae]